MKIGDSITAKIAPTGDGGVDAPVTEVSWVATQAGVFSQAITPDNLQDVLTAIANGTVNQISVSAKNSAGTVLTAQLPLPDVVTIVVPVATALNLTLGPVVPGP